MIVAGDDLVARRSVVQQSAVAVRRGTPAGSDALAGLCEPCRPTAHSPVPNTLRHVSPGVLPQESRRTCRIRRSEAPRHKLVWFHLDHKFAPKPQTWATPGACTLHPLSTSASLPGACWMLVNFLLYVVWPFWLRCDRFRSDRSFDPAGSWSGCALMQGVWVGCFGRLVGLLVPWDCGELGFVCWASWRG
jgi:hypothetical protein